MHRHVDLALLETFYAAVTTRSTRLWGPVRVTTTLATLLAAGPDTVIIKNLRVVLAATDPVPLRVLYGLPPLGVTDLLGDVELVDAPRVWSDDTWLILEPGESLAMRTTAGQVTTSGHGTILTGGGEFP